MRGNEIAMIFQDSHSSLNPTKPIGAQVAEPVRLHRGASRREAADRALEVLELVGLPRPRERLGDYPHQLSGGLRQRVMIAIALACEPRVLIADEPTTALDVTIQAQILSVLDELKERLGMATLLVTHDMGVVAGRADRINVMYAGRIVETAPTDRLFAHMRHPYTQALLGSIPRLDQDASKALVTVPGLPPDLTQPPPGCRFAPRCPRASEQCVAQEPPLDGRRWRAPLRVLASGRGPGHASAPDRGSRARARRRRAASNGSHLLEITDVVREYPVTAGAVLQRGSARSRPSRASPSTSTPARRSASSASRAAARPPSASSSSASRSPTAARSHSVVAPCSRCAAARCVAPGATCR